MSEEEYAEWLSQENRKKVDAMAATVPAPSEDDAEIAAIKEKMPKVELPVSVLDQSVKEIFTSLPNKPQDDYLSRRLEYIISSRLRDVRTLLELKQLLMRDSKVGGSGMTRDPADAMAAQIEEGYKKFHDPIMQEEKTKLDKQMEEQKVKIEQRKAHEAKEHAAWYKEKVLSRKQGDDQRTKIAEQFKQSFADSAAAASTHPMDVKEQKTEVARFGEMVTAVSAGAQPVKAPAVPAAPRPPAISPFAKPASTPTPAAPIASPFGANVTSGAVAQAARPEVKVSKATVDLQTAAASARPRLDDVKYSGPRLTGPLQEMTTLTLTEFRRMAKDPEVAAQKIIQRIEILGQESFEHKIEGIRAWQGCPLQHEYLKLVSESFKTGKPVGQLAEDKRKAGMDVPTPADFPLSLP